MPRMTRRDRILIWMFGFAYFFFFPAMFAVLVYAVNKKPQEAAHPPVVVAHP